MTAIALSHSRPFAARLIETRPGTFVANKLGGARGERIAGWLTEVIPDGATVLDVGAGLGHIARALAERGHEVATVDPVWRPLHPCVHHAASATALPIANRAYDVVLIAFTLHHMPAASHAAALAEARRVARQRVVVLEDTFRSPRERRWCHVVDSVLNAEFRGHPHSNRTAADWLEQLAAAGTHPQLHWERRERWMLLPIRHALLTGEL